MTVLEIMAVAAILGLAAFTLNFAGFGNALVAVPLLALLMPIKAAVALQFPFALILLVYNAWRWRGRVETRRLVVPIIAALIALPLGFLSLEYLPAGVMKKVLAGFIVLAVLALRLGLGLWLSRGAVHKPWLGAMCGLLSGLFQGAYTTGGPPVVVYVRATTNDPGATKGFLGAYFTVIGLATAVMFGAVGLITGPSLLEGLYFSPAVVVGAVLGALAFRRLSSGGYRLVVDGLLITAAVLLWLRS